MGEPSAVPSLWVIGPGRVGLALGLALRNAGAMERIAYTGRRPAPPDHPLFRGTAAAPYSTALAPPEPAPGAVLIAVPDGQIPGVAATLAGTDLPPDAPVLHTSGALGADALAPLSAAGHPVGSLHPLVALSDPVAGADRLRGAWFAIEGDEPAAELARSWVEALEGSVLPVDPGAKPLYHAAAVFASNYLVTLLDVAERLMGRAGVPGHEARAALAVLARGAVESGAELGPANALTGPVSRGDAETVERHLSRLSPSDRALYSVLARETLALARRRDLSAADAEALMRVLGADE